MNLETRDMIVKKLLDTQEAVRDFEMFSKHTKDQEVAQAFKDFAKECGNQANELQRLVDKYN